VKTLQLDGREYEILRGLLKQATEFRMTPEGISLGELQALGATHFGLSAPDSFNIIVNTEKKLVHSTLVSYEDIVAMAGKKGHPSVVFHRGPLPKPDGCLAPGEQVYLREGMVFAVQHTGNA